MFQIFGNLDITNHLTVKIAGEAASRISDDDDDDDGMVMIIIDH